MRFRHAISVVTLFAFAFPPTLVAGDNLKADRGQMKQILGIVAADIQKHFYDPAFKGLDLKAAVDEARGRIEKAQNVNEMLQAISDFAKTLNDSHTSFDPPRNAMQTKYGFRIKAFGDEIRVYDIEKNGAAEKAGLKVGDRVASINDDIVSRERLTEIRRRHWRFVALNPMMVMIKDGPGQYRQVDVFPKIVQKQAVHDRWNRYSELWGDYIEEQNIWEKYYTSETGLFSASSGSTTAPTGSGSGNSGGEIGYLNLRTFMYEDTGLLRFIDRLKSAKALVIDLRDNRGGAVSTEIAFLGMFESSEVELGKSSSRTEIKPLTVKPRAPHFDVPLVVLIDSESASAAEIAARWLQKRHKAIIVGDKSGGFVNMSQEFEGQVGTTVVVDFGTQITIARVEIDGETLEGNPVVPDIKCIPSQAEMRARTDPCLDLALKAAQNTINTKPKTETASK